MNHDQDDDYVDAIAWTEAYLRNDEEAKAAIGDGCDALGMCEALVRFYIEALGMPALNEPMPYLARLRAAFIAASLPREPSGGPDA